MKLTALSALFLLYSTSVDAFDRNPSPASEPAGETTGQNVGARRLGAKAESSTKKETDKVRKLKGSKSSKGSSSYYYSGSSSGSSSYDYYDSSSSSSSGDYGKGYYGYMPPPGKGYPMPPGKGVMPPPGKGYPMPPGKGIMPPPGKGYPMPPGKGVMPPPGKGATMPPGKGVMPPPGKGATMPPGKGVMPPPGKGATMPPGKGMMPPPGKGMMPPPGKGEMSGKGGTVASCSPLNVFFLIDELRNGYSTNGIGGTFDNVPFYASETGELLGYYSDASTNLQSGDCVGSGSFSFGFEPNFLSQITFQFTCNGEFNTITGGNGQFGCASGYEEEAYEDETVISSIINICGDLCPR